MSKFTDLLIGLSSVAAIAMSGCAKDAPFIGDWETAPVAIEQGIPPTSTGTAATSIAFMHGDDNTGGKVTLSQDYDIRQHVGYGSGMTFEVHVAGTATVDGAWTYDVDDDDDLLLTFNPATMKLDIDTNEVVCNEASENEAVKAACDTLKAQGLPMWKMTMEDLLRRQMSHFSVVEDVELAKDKNTLSIDLENPDRKLVLTRK